MALVGDLHVLLLLSTLLLVSIIVVASAIQHTMTEHPKTIINSQRASKVVCDDDEELIAFGMECLQEQAVLQPCCKDKLGSCKDKQCSCLSVFMVEDDTVEQPLTEAVARCMVCFAKKKQHEQWAIVADWIRCADRDKNQSCLLPHIRGEEKTMTWNQIKSMERFARWLF